MHRLGTGDSGSIAGNARRSPVFYVATLSILAICCHGLWGNWQAFRLAKTASPIHIQAAAATFASSERNQKAFIGEDSEGSGVWLIKTDLVLQQPIISAVAVHCAWSGSLCRRIRHMPQRGPVNAKVLPVDFSPYYWLLEATVNGEPIALEADQRSALHSKLSHDRNTFAVIAALTLLVVWLVWWIWGPTTIRPSRR